MMLVASPLLFARDGIPDKPADVFLHTLLQHVEVPGAWKDLRKAYRLRGTRQERLVRYDYYSVLIRAAISGMGMALIPEFLVRDELNSGVLINPLAMTYEARSGYYFMCAEEKRIDPVLGMLRKWLLPSRPKWTSDAFTPDLWRSMARSPACVKSWAMQGKRKFCLLKAWHLLFSSKSWSVITQLRSNRPCLCPTSILRVCRLKKTCCVCKLFKWGLHWASHQVLRGFLWALTYPSTSFKENHMKTSTQSILLASMLAASGFAIAQNTVSPADRTPASTRAEVKSQSAPESSAGDKRGQGPQIQTPGAGKASDNTRAEVKSQITPEGSAGDKRGQGPQIQTPGAGKASETTRAEVKRQISPEGSAGDKRGQGPFVNTPSGGGSESSRVGVKNQIDNKGTSGVRGEGPMIDNKSKMTTAERKRMRDERRAAAKAKREGNMKSGSSKAATPAS